MVENCIILNYLNLRLLSTLKILIKKQIKLLLQLFDVK